MVFVNIFLFCVVLLRVFKFFVWLIYMIRVLWLILYESFSFICVVFILFLLKFFFWVVFRFFWDVLKILLLVVMDLFEGVVVMGFVLVGGRWILYCFSGSDGMFFVIGDIGVKGKLLIDLLDLEFVVNRWSCCWIGILLVWNDRR